MNTKTQSPHPVGSSAWLAAVESLRDTWADRAGYLETLSKNNDGIFGQMQSQQAQNPGKVPAVDSSTGDPVFATQAEISSGKYISL